jgi:Rrf2 family protein
MKLNTKVRYGIRTMLEIASDESGDGVFQKDIAEKQDLSVKYLDHIIRALKKQNLVSNVAGKKSGYRLSRKPSLITLYDIYLAFEPELSIVHCVSGDASCDKEGECKVAECWGSLNKIIVDYLQGETLDKVMNSGCSIDK